MSKAFASQADLRGKDGSITDDPQRNAEYTRELGVAIAGAFRRETVLLTTHLVARAVFDGVAARAGTRDIYRLLRMPPAQMEVPTTEVLASISRLRVRLEEEPELGRVHERIHEMSAEAVLHDALRGLQSYHTHPVVEQGADVVRVGSMKLLYYYANRADHIPAEDLP